MRSIAVGAWKDRRVRVISLRDFSIIHELNTNENPYWPFGGAWRIADVNFSPSGNYLIIESLHSGRLKEGQRITEIIDVKNWDVVRKLNDVETDVHSVTLSTDDKKIAFIQNNPIKIISFVSK
jgi:hypothetical protein